MCETESAHLCVAQAERLEAWQLLQQCELAIVNRRGCEYDRYGMAVSHLDGRANR
jgi:hypothetical protein